MKFVALPRLIEAVQWQGRLEDIPAEWRLAETFTVEEETGDLIVPTREGPSHAQLGGWLVKGTEGEFYPIRRAVHAAKYRPAGPLTRLISHVVLRLLGVTS